MDECRVEERIEAGSAESTDAQLRLNGAGSIKEQKVRRPTALTADRRRRISGRMRLAAAARQRCKWTLLYGADCCGGIKFSSDHDGWPTGLKEMLMPREQRRPINGGDALSCAASRS